MASEQPAGEDVDWMVEVVIRFLQVLLCWFKCHGPPQRLCGRPSRATAVPFARSQGPLYTVPLMAFIDENCLVFDNEEEQKFEYTTARDLIPGSHSRLCMKS